MASSGEFVDSLGKTFRSALDVVGDEAGMHLTVLLPPGYRDQEIAGRALHHNLSLWPLSRMYMTQPRQGFILGFGGTSMKEIPLAVRTLQTLLIRSK